MKLPLLLWFSITLVTPALPGDVTSWRNGGNGIYKGISAPADWNREDSILWKVNTPVWGNACPLVIGDKLFYTAEPADLICADARTGSTLWVSSNAYEDVADLSDDERAGIKRIIVANENLASTLEPLRRKVYQLNRRLRNDASNENLKCQLEKARKELAALEADAGVVPGAYLKPKTHDTNGYASMTPCSDGQYIYFSNGLGIVTKLDLDGNRVWAKVMERPDHNWGASVSPQLVGGKLIVRFADYAALDPDTGEELWRVEDPHTFGSPAYFQVENDWYLYTVRGELIRVADGKKLPSQDWTIEQLAFAFFNTPFVDGNRVYVVHGAAGIQGDVYCMEIPSTSKELETRGLKQRWHTVASKERYYTSPIAHEGILYIFSMGQVFQALDTETGEIIYSHKISGMKGRAFSGILLVDDKLYVGEEDGMAVFVKPGPEYEELHRFDLGECRSTPVFDGDTAYLRTREQLIAFKSN